MKRSKKIFVRLLLKFAKKYLPLQLYSLILFLRSFRKFKNESCNSMLGCKENDLPDFVLGF